MRRNGEVWLEGDGQKSYKRFCSPEEGIWVDSEFKIKCWRALSRGVMWFLKYYKKHFDLTWFGEGKGRSREKSIMKNSVRFFFNYLDYENILKWVPNIIGLLWNFYAKQLHWNFCLTCLEYISYACSNKWIPKCMSIKYKNVKLNKQIKCIKQHSLGSACSNNPVWNRSSSLLCSVMSSILFFLS